jgi:glucose-6-phosphate 1-dehydrogenase
MSRLQTAIVILGATGDLAKRKLMPALNRLFEQGRLPESSIIIGSGRKPVEEETFRSGFELDPAFTEKLFYHQGIKGLKEYVKAKGDAEKCIFFMALPPEVYASTAKQLNEEGFASESSIVIEKPFGYDYPSSKKLNQALKEFFSESQIFRIDHYLAKEAVQNILIFRFANSIFYPIWNKAYIESIQINALETIGIEDRGPYFDKAGIIRDMVQNHLMQLLCLLTMEAPVSLDANDIRAQKVNILKVLKIEDCVKYQYKGYQEEKGVAKDSAAETFVEIKLSINDFRWTGVPVYIRCGKAMHRKGTEVGIRLRSLPRLLYNEKGEIKPNNIIFKIQPAAGIILDLSTKVPGSEDQITGTTMNFCYQDAFEGEIPEAYQKLLLDVIHGDHTLFVSSDETETAWQKFEGILDRSDPLMYEKGSKPPSKYEIEWIDFDRYSTIC